MLKNRNQGPAAPPPELRHGHPPPRRPQRLRLPARGILRRARLHPRSAPAGGLRGGRPKIPRPRRPGHFGGRPPRLYPATGRHMVAALAAAGNPGRPDGLLRKNHQQGNARPFPEGRPPPEGPLHARQSQQPHRGAPDPPGFGGGPPGRRRRNGQQPPRGNRIPVPNSPAHGGAHHQHRPRPPGVFQNPRGGFPGKKRPLEVDRKTPPSGPLRPRRRRPLS